MQLLRFVEGESTFDYMQATKLYIERYGKPVAFYSDKHTVFHINKRSGVRGNGMTQYSRALHELGIEIMCANTPAAKGRVERVPPVRVLDADYPARYVRPQPPYRANSTATYRLITGVSGGAIS